MWTFRKGCIKVKKTAKDKSLFKDECGTAEKSVKPTSSDELEDLLAILSGKHFTLVAVDYVQTFHLVEAEIIPSS